MIKKDLRTGFIGAGNMCEAIVGAMVKSGLFHPSMILVSDIDKKRLDLFENLYAVTAMDDNFKLFLESDVVIIAVKPQQVSEVLLAILKQNNFELTKRKLIISIAAGYSTKKIEDIFYPCIDENSRSSLPIIRVMPNTPALAMAGMSGICMNKFTTDEDAALARKILETTGKVLEFKEEVFDGITALSGSGPAYVFYLIESMIKGGVEAGLDYDKAFVLAMETVKGATALLEQMGEAPEVLRKKVTSPGGTTEAAIKVFDDNMVKQNIVKGILAAANRSRELGQLDNE